MKTRFVIVPRRAGIYTIPKLETRTFESSFFLGSWCANDGSLWTSLNDGEHIFDDETAAREKLQEIITNLTTTP